MFYSLAKIEDDFHAKNTYKVLAMAPCFNTKAALSFEGIKTLDAWQEAGVYAFGGPNQEEDEATICKNFDKRFCTFY